MSGSSGGREMIDTPGYRLPKNKIRHWPNGKIRNYNPEFNAPAPPGRTRRVRIERRGWLPYEGLIGIGKIKFSKRRRDMGGNGCQTSN